MIYPHQADRNIPPSCSPVILSQDPGLRHAYPSRFSPAGMEPLRSLQSQSFLQSNHGEVPVRFRWLIKDKCFQGQPQLFCKDIWWNGFGRLAVVPSVNLGYTNAARRRVKKQKGYVTDVVEKGLGGQKAGGKSDLDITTNWQLEPLERVKCMLNFKNQSWLSWNESLTRGR